MNHLLELHLPQLSSLPRYHWCLRLTFQTLLPDTWQHMISHLAVAHKSSNSVGDFWNSANISECFIMAFKITGIHKSSELLRKYCFLTSFTQHQLMSISYQTDYQFDCQLYTLLMTLVLEELEKEMHCHTNISNISRTPLKIRSLCSHKFTKVQLIICINIHMADLFSCVL